MEYVTPSGRTVVDGPSIWDVHLQRESSADQELCFLDADGRASPEGDGEGFSDVDRLIARHESRDLRTVGVFDVKNSKAPPLKKVEEDIPASPLLQPSAHIASLTNVRSQCFKTVPGWHLIPGGPEALEVHQLCEGLSNQLFRVSTPEDFSGSSFSRVLFRVYGDASESFYSPEDELNIFRMLSHYRIAPSMIAHGPGFRIEEWHFAVAVPTSSLGNPSIFCQTASQIARMHKLHRRMDFPADLKPKVRPDGTLECATLDRLHQWGQEALKVRFTNENMQRDLIAMRIDAVVPAETDWLREYILEGSTGCEGQGLDLVLSHNDVQENNILQTEYGLRLIDFEYTAFNYQAYDIANFFTEFTMDYVGIKDYPYYSVNHENFPSEEKQRLFLSIYLSEYLEQPILPDDTLFVDPLMKSVRKFVLVSHLLWGLWSVIRTPQGQTYGDFDFLHYGKFRLDQYHRLKLKFTEEDRAATKDVLLTNITWWKIQAACMGALSLGLLAARFSYVAAKRKYNK